ncbi:hypothetical protein LCGC14_1133200 [marine sediment metagenome]|uniref:Lysine--tRNA ligase n=1 Tax=marine sediment metagenome TaxID=412755 RepID=A0A0F9PIR6_9ZZZZ
MFYLTENSWPYKEAEKVLNLVQKKNKNYACFQCGFGPSGSPHIGTISEMLRTKMIIEAFRNLSNDYYVISWILFADDMDALRKVPDNVPNKEDMEKYIGVPICDIPDPWDRDDSFAAHNIRELVELLERFNLTQDDYILYTASEMYRKGTFNPMLNNFAKKAEEIKKIVTHDYGEERINTYCPFLPIIDKKTIHELYEWRVCYTPHEEEKAWMLHFYAEALEGPINESERCAEMVSLFDGNCKLQWKVDWPLRWYALNVDYEMHGKDLLGSAQVGDRIMRLINQRPPLHMMYELFLDEDGKKISKSKGDSTVLQEWLEYTTVDVLNYFLFQNPRKSRKMHFGIIPQITDQYLKERGEEACPISFSMLLNLVSITNTNDPDLLWEFVRNYVEDATAEKYPLLDILISKAINFYNKKILPHKEYRDPTHWEYITLVSLRIAINRVRKEHEAVIKSGKDLSEYGGEQKVLEEALTTTIYDVGKDMYKQRTLREFFQMIYEVLMGQKSGPRLPVFVMLYGMDNTIKLLDEIIKKNEYLFKQLEEKNKKNENIL